MPKGTGLRRLLIAFFVTFISAGAASAQRLTSFGLASGAMFSEGTEPTAAFSASATLRAGLSWLLVASRTVADVKTSSPATQRDVSIAFMAMFPGLDSRLFVAGGASLNKHTVERVGGDDESERQLGGVAIAGLRLPLAGEGVLLELIGRVDAQETIMRTALLGVRVRLGVPNSLALGEPQVSPEVVARRAVWNEVLMQLILLQGELESFTRIKEIETGIELEFDATRVTLWDDVAKTARVLAAAEPPVVITTFGPNAGRVAAAVTAGSFPAERVRLQRADRVYLRVEH